MGSLRTPSYETLHRIAVPALLIYLSTAVARHWPNLAEGTYSDQDWITSGINLGAPKIKLAVPDFPPKSPEQQLVGA